MSRDLPPATPEIGRASQNDLACLAEAVYFEARGTGPAGETAVANVVVNRAKSRKFPNSVCGVVGDGCQFSYRCDGRADVLADPGARDHAFKVAEHRVERRPGHHPGRALLPRRRRRARLVQDPAPRRHLRRQHLLPLSGSSRQAAFVDRLSGQG